MKNKHMVRLFTAQDSRRRERPCGHGHDMVRFFAVLSNVTNKMTMSIAHVIHLTCARARVRVQNYEKSWSFVERYSIIGHETRPCHDHVHMVIYIRNMNNTIKNLTMSLFSFSIKLTQGGL